MPITSRVFRPRWSAKELSRAILGLMLLSGTVASAQTTEGFKPLFNGKDLTGWDGDSRFWRVEDGEIVGQTTKEVPTEHNTFLIYRGDRKGGDGGSEAHGKTFGDFELHAKFKLTNHNSGIQYRSRELPEHVMTGYQADIAEGKPSPYTGMLYEERARGIIAKRGQKVTIDESGKKTVEQFGDDKEMGNAIDMSQWHDYTIIAKGNHLTQIIDGKTTMELIDNEPGKSAKDGLLGLQIHAGQPMRVEFKDIEIKELKDDSK